MEVDADTDVRPRLIVACAIAAVRVATDVWVAGAGADDLAAVIDDALELLVDGFAPGLTPQAPLSGPDCVRTCCSVRRPQSAIPQCAIPQ